MCSPTVLALLPLLFIVVTVSEIAVLLTVGDSLGVPMTLVAIVLTALVGTSLMRQQGLMTLRRAQNSMNRGVPPARELVDGVLILAAGLLLITPGFITDGVGFFLLFPLTRALLRVYLMRWVNQSMTGQWAEQQPTRASEIEIIDDQD